MSTVDYSNEIYEKYYNSKNKVLEITLKNNTILEGIFVGAFHGDPEQGETYVIKWNFVPSGDITEYNSLGFYARKNDFEKIIFQEEIEFVQFKTS